MCYGWMVQILWENKQTRSFVPILISFFFLFRIIKNVSECFVIHLLTSENDERIFCADTVSILRFCKNIFIVFTKYLKIDFFLQNQIFITFSHDY